MNHDFSNRLFSAPTMVNLELTEICNFRCAHCYNPWREESLGNVSLDEERINALVAAFKEAGIFHVVLTGGEPFARFNILEYAIRTLSENGMSVSCNSNLSLVTKERVERLADAGLDHILTSLPSHDPVIFDRIMVKIGAFEKVETGIKLCSENGIRVSANMVITRSNMDHVYDVGRLLASWGGQKLFVTRSVPPSYSAGNDLNEYTFTSEEARRALDDALRVKQDFGIMIGTLVSYPLCFLGDLEKYSDFVGRGCPSQSGHRMSMNATGDLHVCVHEEEEYGNIFDSSIQEIYQSKMRPWHTGEYVFEGCKTCDYLKVCTSGCSMASQGHYGSRAAKDPLYMGPSAIYRDFQFSGVDSVGEKITSDTRFKVPKRLRFRREDGFFLVNIRWANTISVANAIAEFLMSYQETQAVFTLREFTSGTEAMLKDLFYKDVIECLDEDICLTPESRMQGTSVNIEDLPRHRKQAS